MDQMPVRVFVVSPRTGDIILGAPGAANPDKNHCMQTKFCISQGLDWAFPLLFRYSLLSRTGSLKLQVPTRNSHLRPAKIAISPPPHSPPSGRLFSQTREKDAVCFRKLFSLFLVVSSLSLQETAHALLVRYLSAASYYSSGLQE